MKFSGRSQWLIRNNDLVKVERSGKKKFIIQKNKESDLFPTPLDNIGEINNRKTELPSLTRNSKSITPTGFRHNDFLSNSPKIKELEEKIKQQDSQIAVMRNLYSEANYNLKKSSVSVSRIRPTIQKSDFREKISIFSSPDQNKSSSYKAIRRINSQSDSNIKIKATDYLNLAAKLAFRQKRFTKNQPKIVLSNPITGIVPNFNYSP